MEKAQDAISEEDAARMMKRMLSSKFDFEDFLNQYKSVNKMGALGSVMKMIPGMNQMDDKDFEKVERKYAMYETIIDVRPPLCRPFSVCTTRLAVIPSFLFLDLNSPFEFKFKSVAPLQGGVLPRVLPFRLR